ncbi:MAG: type II toxin-antitoxin system VapC family toxin [Firmicutes bacterium]|nr:type II toxin-antitoxin system VapC family toxin [Bacillota bacterium]
MRTLRLYLETSVFNFIFADDAPDKKADTLKLFDEIRSGKFVPYTSDYVVGELELAPQPKREQMLDFINRYGIRMLEKSEHSERLAGVYVAEGIIPEKYKTDALHIAVATAHELDMIVSWNFKHIVRHKTIRLTESVNLREGYKKIWIHSPMEVIYDE